VVEANASAVEMFGDEVIGAYWGKSRGASERTLRHGTLVTIDTNNDRDDRLRELGRTQAALAHQIRNPLTVAGLSIEQLLLTQSGAEVRERLERVRDSLQAIEQQIRNALVFVRGELTERHTFAVTELVAAMRDAWSMLLDGRDVSWTESYCGRDFIAGDLATLVGALTNIVDNAIAIGGAHVKLTIAVEASLGALCVTITDNGPGMDADLLARARQPFVSGRPGGTGLGLAIVDAVVKAHGGRFSLDSAPGEGTRAHVELPLVGGAAR
jgi:two-component system sensor histidine kinase FlrB